MQHLNEIKNRDRGSHESIDILGDHLFTYYLWEMYPLNGRESLIEQFYQRTEKTREHWANLFSCIGHRLRNSGKNLDPNMKNRIIAFFEWRLKQKEPTELRHFTSWLQAECLNAEWRLNAYSKVLDVCEVEDWGLYFETLREMLSNHTPKVVECFFKLTEGSKKDNIYVPTEEAKAILKAGLKSSNENVRHNAKLAHENLLKTGRFDLLNLDD